MASIFVDGTNESKHTTREENAAGHMTPIVVHEPPRGTKMQLQNAVQRGQRTWGVPVTAKLYDSNGDLLPIDSEFRFEVLTAGSSDPIAVSRDVEDISTWNNLTVAEQGNTDHIDATKVELAEPEDRGGDRLQAVTWRDIDQFRVSLLSSEVVDWTQGSQLSIDPSAVEGPHDRGGR